MSVEIFHAWVGYLPFEWAQYAFMQRALVAVLFIAPVFALLGTLVLTHRMAFFPDTIAHGMLTGVALAMASRLEHPMPIMLVYALILVTLIHWTQRLTKAPMDSVLSIYMSFTVALGIVLLSRQGSFAKFSHFLVGDLLAAKSSDLPWLGLMLLAVTVLLLRLFNRALVISIEPNIARVKFIQVEWVKFLFSALVALAVTLATPWVGILVIQSLIILPVAAARNVAFGVRQFVWVAIFLSCLAGVTGLLISYYASTATGATISLVTVFFYLLTVVVYRLRR